MRPLHHVFQQIVVIRNVATLPKIKCKSAAVSLVATPLRRNFHKSSANDNGHFKDRFGDRLKNMSVQSAVEDLTQVCIELRRIVNAAKDDDEKEKIVLKHIKSYAETGLRVSDFAKGVKRNRKEAFEDDSTPRKEAPAKRELSEEEMEEYAKLLETKRALELELADLKKNSQLHDSIKEVMELLHDYNDIKDATQIVLGALANLRGVTIASLHEEFDLPLKDE